MLLNNFKLLFQFYPDSTFVNVLGETVNKGSILAGQPDTDRFNGHACHASNLLYNYNPNMGSNGYINEQAKYPWTGITGGRCENSLYGRYNGFILFVGSGDTPPTPDDYKLENAVELGVLTASCIHYANGRTIVSREFFNNKGEDVTIKEIGCYLFATNSWSNSVNSSEYIPIVMIGRKVLKNPVTILTGELYTFNYTIDMSQIAFTEVDD